MMNTINQTKKDNELVFEMKKSFILPCIMMVFVFCLNIIYKNYFVFLSGYINVEQADLVENFIYFASLGLLCYWLFCRLINKFSHYLLTTSYVNLHQTIKILLPFLTSLFKLIFGLSLINCIAPYLGLPEDLAYFFKKGTSILIIISISWILFKLIAIAEQLLLNHYASTSSGDLFTRKIFTQTLILKRIGSGIIIILTVGAILMLFDNVRTLGASVLTTAGVLGLVLTFTAQRSLGSIFSGLEIALTQPIKIGDSIVIENEFGTVEEINFRSVVIKLWDWRRLIVPTSFFLEKTFQNWSREQNNNLIGTVYLYVDFTLSVDILRAQLKKILDNSLLWDKKVITIQVSDIQEKVMQLRVLASARTPADAWDLCCEIREQLIAYIVNNHPDALPMTRTQSFQNPKNKVINSTPNKD